MMKEGAYMKAGILLSKSVKVSFNAQNTLITTLGVKKSTAFNLVGSPEISD